MGTPNEKSSELNRGSSLRASVRLSNIPGDDDDYDLQAMGVADGFRPVEAPETHLSRNPITTLQDAPTAQVPPPRPSSITKPHRRGESLTLQHDGSMTGSETDISRSRTSSPSRTSPFVDPEEPYEGPSGPSHPYQMYPQNVRVARTASVATTSTAPVSERSYNGPRGPAHPYGMYPQNTVPEADGMVSRTAQDEIGVGFPGATDNYQRRIGPDGEDVADLIGPDGHTEQLPPYTRYPEETYNRKAMGLETPQPAPAQPIQPLPAQPMLAIPGTGGIGMATRNPEFASTEDLNRINSPQSRQSVRSFTSEGSSRTLNNSSQSATNEMDEKKPEKEWRTTAKRRVWGIVPCWAIVLAGIVLVLMGIILGAVIGTSLNRHGRKGPPPNKPPSPAVSPSWDTQPLETLPSNLPSLQTGTFAMPLMNNRISNTCFSDSTLAQAWTCNLVFSQLSMTVEKLDGQPNISDYSFGFSNNETFTLENHVYSYGVQPPDLSNMTLKLVSDLYEPSRGPAWNFEVIYDKIVIIPEQFLTPSFSTPSIQNDRRMLFGGDDFKRKGIAQPGEKPWVCYWNDTILEVFIYAGQNNSFSRPIDPRPTTSTTTLSESVPGAPASVPTAQNTGLPSDIDNGGVFKPSAVVDFGNADDRYTSALVTDGVPVTTTTSSPATSSSDWFGKDPFMPDGPPPPVYPRVVKVEERRSSFAVKAKPFCRQYRVVGEYQEAEAVLDDNGNMIEIEIDEDERDFDVPGPSQRSVIENYIRTSRGAKSGSDMSDCGCMWWLT
ncbi:hypothetical protein F4818DRAFT_457064 [Hypoxylon cercidicola]|nr:hypothetical protein F4818DRAFT_457064 [Hypoxylon cercidicola]